MRQICRTELDCELAKHARLLRSRGRVNVTVALEFISFRDPESFTVSAAHTKVDDEVVVSLVSVVDNARTIRVSMCTTLFRPAHDSCWYFLRFRIDWRRYWLCQNARDSYRH